MDTESGRNDNNEESVVSRMPSSLPITAGYRAQKIPKYASPF